MWIPIAEAAIAIGGAILQSSAQSEYYDEQQEALEIQEEEQKLTSINQSLRANDELDRMIGRQTVIEASTGITPESFAPLKVKQFDEFANDRNAINLNLQFKDFALDSEMEQISDAKFWSPILNLFQAGDEIWNTWYEKQKKKTPELKTSNTSRYQNIGNQHQHELVNP